MDENKPHNNPQAPQASSISRLDRRAAKKKRWVNLCRRMPLWARIVACTAGVVVAIVGVSAGYVYNRLNRLAIPSVSFTPEPTVEETPEPTRELGGTPVPLHIDTDNVADVEMLEGTFSVLLLGIDARDKDTFFNSLSDSMILLTIDPANETIKMTSFMRDILVRVEGYGKNRLNTAFRFGNFDLVQKTFLAHFGLAVDNYAVVNFWGLADIIDNMGGIDIELTSEEVREINGNLAEINKDRAQPVPDVPSPGLQHLNGTQAVAYARIRHLSGGDFARTTRQRIVMTKAIERMEAFNLVELLQFIDKLPEYLVTNIPKNELLKIAATFAHMNNFTMHELRIPAEGTYYLDMYNDTSVIIMDFDKNSQMLQAYMAQAKPTPAP